MSNQDSLPASIGKFDNSISTSATSDELIEPGRPPRPIHVATIQIMSPSPNSFLRGSSITVTGEASFEKFIGDIPEDKSEQISTVEVQLGNRGIFVQATPTGTGNKKWSKWSFTGSTAEVIAPGDRLLITAQVIVKVIGNLQEIKKTASVTVRIDRTPPVLEIASPPNGAEVVLVDNEVKVALKGTATDALTGVAVVEWALDGQNQFTQAIPNGREPLDWSTWNAEIQLSSAGEHTIAVRAKDGEGNTATQQLKLNAVPSFAPKDIKNATSTAEYLNDLLNFASHRLRTAPASSGSLITRSLLASTFYQSFDALTNSIVREIVQQPVHQVRLGIEVLRKYFGDPPVAEESNYCQAAYNILLRELGTSSEEIRLARAADEDTRKALANRLGINLSLTRPDELDRLMLPTDQITEANLEQIFGLLDIKRKLFTDSEPPELNLPPKANLLQWKLAHLHELWQQQDNAIQSDTENFSLIIDPDQIIQDDLRDAIPGNLAFNLWQERQQEVNAKLEEIKVKRESETTPLAGFEAIVSSILGSVDELVDLANQYKQGNSIESQLKAKHLSLQPFLYLMRIRSLASAGTVLDEEWTDVYSILLQVYKQRERYPEWRQQEQQNNLALNPDYFQLSTANTSTIQLPQWRATQQARQSWQNTLEARINQKQTVENALEAAIDATEEATLPSLRDALIAVIHPQLKLLDAANRLTRELCIDLQSSGNQKTTRIHQAIDTLQSIFFSVRTSRFGETDPATDWEIALTKEYTEADFDEEWQWMGAYTTWRSAMMVFLRPENFLLPNLRQRQTPAFRNLVDELRSNRRITPERVRAIAKTYSDYYRDVCSLTVEASCQTKTRISDEEQKIFFYMFGRSSITQQVYWSAYDPQATPDDAQTFWDIVPGIDKVDTIVGAVPYQISNTERFIYLFVQGQEKSTQKLSFIRYDLERSLWDTEPTDLELPSGYFTIIAVQMRTEQIPPELFLRGAGIFVRSLDKQGSGWETSTQDASSRSRDDWAIFRLPGYSTGGVKLRAVLKTDTSAASRTYWFCYTQRDGNLRIVKQIDVLSSPSASFTKDLGVLSFIGAFQCTSSDEIFVAHENASGNFSCQKLTPPSTGDTLRAVQISVPVALNKVQRIAASYGTDTVNQRRVIYQRLGTASDQEDGNFRAVFTVSGSSLTESESARIAPHTKGPFEITEKISEAELLQRKAAILAAFENNISTPRVNRTYLEEAYYFIPLHLALQLQQQREYIIALDWLQTIYAYSLPMRDRKIYHGLLLEESIDSQFRRRPDWLSDLNPHNIATERKNAYTRFTILSLVRCFQEYADSEFTREARESISTARILYMAALELLDLEEMKDPSNAPLPPNPILDALRWHLDLNLFKLRQGLNIAGLEQQIELETPPEAIALPTFGNNRSIGVSPPTSLRPTQYRYAVLIERAKQLVAIAQQIEVAFLSALEKRDAEAYTLLKARQDMQLSRAGVRLQDLRVREAEGGVKLAELQQQRSQIQADHFQNLITQGRSTLENLAIGFMIASAALQTSAAVLQGGSAILSALTFGLLGTNTGAADAASSLAAASSTTASILSTYASYERRAQEWEFQKILALQDIRIGAQQINAAQDRMRVVGQERFIAEMQADQAEATVDFLANKFTNYELFDWMSGILERVYAYFLQQATAIAKLAEIQLAFERQEFLPSSIRADYWEVPTGDSLASANGNAPDRRGLTGSARLQQDLYQLDQYAFETNQRKLQLTKTISLAQLSPAEFQRFRETGVIIFDTPMELFDRDFPGHYLRLIKRVRTSVIAFIPPQQGIRATLSAAGVSRVTIGDAVFQTVVINNGSQSVALSSPLNATGLFELVDEQPELRLPFEGSGVGTVWEFNMPKPANHFDYNTIADVLVTIEYTALASPIYRQQVIQTLNPNLSADRAFSFRHQFADQWYDLQNSEQTTTPMVVRFETRREDYPPNLEELKIQQVVLYFARAKGQSFEIKDAQLLFKPQGSTDFVGGAAGESSDCIISTRRSNASSWTSMIIGESPIGEWELALPDTEEMKQRFKDGQIEDILFVITYSGRTLNWPM